MHASPPRRVAIAKAPADGSWRGRTLLACSLAGAGVIAAGAAGLDWSEGAAIAMGQIAGMTAPLALLGLALWGVAALTGRRS